MDTKIPSSYELYLFHEGSLDKSYKIMGAHTTKEKGVKGVRFNVWAPDAKLLKVVGDFNEWNGNNHNLRRIADSGIWTLFVPDLKKGDIYKYELETWWGKILLKSDPFAFYSELRPKTASVIYDLDNYNWNDDKWQKQKKSEKSVYKSPINIYEVHLGSWKIKEDGEPYSYRELAKHLVEYVKEMGYTHVELMPIMEHPYDGSWGYQITGYFSVTSRYGTPEDFKYLIDQCHQNNIGVILDWVPAHFCKDAHGLASFDGNYLYEKQENEQWGTLDFDFGNPGVVSFLISNAIFWFEEYHIDGLRVDAVASMLYLDYSNENWEPNKYGGRENLESQEFMKKLNKTVFKYFPTALMFAEESSQWPLVTQPTHLGGLGYNYKWNMGWMNDILKYMEIDPIHRKWHHNLLTFSFMYTFSENFLLPLSHDEVVHGKKSLIERMPGDYWRKFAGLRAMYAYMIGHPGKKLLFMGGEFGQFIEWRYYEELDWFLLDYDMHIKCKKYVKDLNHFYLSEKALYEQDHDWSGFQWIDANNYNQSIIIFMRIADNKDDYLIVVCNFTPNYYEHYRIGVPTQGQYEEVFNSDKDIYGGSNKVNAKPLKTQAKEWQDQAFSIDMKIPPLAVVFLKKVQKKAENKIMIIEEEI